MTPAGKEIEERVAGVFTNQAEKYAGLAAAVWGAGEGVARFREGLKMKVPGDVSGEVMGALVLRVSTTVKGTETVSYSVLPVLERPDNFFGVLGTEGEFYPLDPSGGLSCISSDTDKKHLISTRLEEEIPVLPIPDGNWITGLTQAKTVSLFLNDDRRYVGEQAEVAVGSGNRVGVAGMVIDLTQTAADLETILSEIRRIQKGKALAGEEAKIAEQSGEITELAENYRDDFPRLSELLDETVGKIGIAS